MFIYCDDNIDGFVLVWDIICREGDRGDIIGGKAAPHGVATEHIFGYGEGGGGYIVLCLYLCDIIGYMGHYTKNATYSECSVHNE